MLPLYKTVISWREQVTIYHVMLPLYKTVISRREQVTIYHVMLPLYKTVILWREQVTTYHVMLPLYKTNTLNLIYFCASSLKQQSIGRHVGPLRFQANQSLLIRLNAVYAKCLVDKQQIPILQELLTPPDNLSSSPVFGGFFGFFFVEFVLFDL
jgi:hypothetical protein